MPAYRMQATNQIAHARALWRGTAKTSATATSNAMSRCEISHMSGLPAASGPFKMLVAGSDARETWAGPKLGLGYVFFEETGLARNRLVHLPLLRFLLRLLRRHAGPLSRWPV